MAVMTPREKWTDERLDDLNKKVDDGFARLDADIRELRGEMKEQGNSLRKELKDQGDSLRGEMNARFNAIDARFDALNRNLFAGAAVIIAALIGPHLF